MPTQPTPTQQLAAMLAKFEPALEKFGHTAHRKLAALLPTATRLVYDNYNFFVIGFTPARPSDAILSLAMDAHGVRLCFLWGKGLPDPEGLLRGSGNQVRSLTLATPADLDRPAIRALIAEAVRRSRAPMPATGKGALIIQSISAKQRPRRAEPKPAKANPAKPKAPKPKKP